MHCWPSMTTQVKESSGFPTTAPKKCLGRLDSIMSTMSSKSFSHCFVDQS